MYAFRQSPTLLQLRDLPIASQSVAHSDSIAAFIPDLELLITEAMGEWKVPGLAIAGRQFAGRRRRAHHGRSRTGLGSAASTVEPGW
jgi:hypothetical protein